MSSDPHPSSKSSKIIYHTNTHWVNNHDSKQYYFKDLMLNDIHFLINENKKNDIKNLFNKLNKSPNKIIIINSTLSKEQKIKNLKKFLLTSTMYLNEEAKNDESLIDPYDNESNINKHNDLLIQTIKETIQPNAHLYILISQATNHQTNTIYVCHFDNECNLSHIKNIALSQLMNGIHEKYFEKDVNIMNHFILNEEFNFYSVKELVELLNEQKGVPLSFINPLEKHLMCETEFA
jgi:hypothetical protein